MGAFVKEAGRKISEMGFIAGGGLVNWFPGHMAAATHAIRQRLKLADLVIEVRDARIPLSSANSDIQDMLAEKRHLIALNKKDLANQNIVKHWLKHFDSINRDCLAISSHSRSSVSQLLALVELILKEKISREPTLLVMVVGVPNVGKSALINQIHRIAVSRFPVEEKIKRATVGPLPGVTQDIAGYKIANCPSIYVLDTPGVLVPTIPDMDTGLKLALTGAVKDTVVGEDRLAKYLLSILNVRKTPFHWERLVNSQKVASDDQQCKNDVKNWDLSQKRRRLDRSDIIYVEDMERNVKGTLYATVKDFTGDIDDENELETLVHSQLDALRRALKISSKAPDDEAQMMVSKKLLTLFRLGKLGTFVLDTVPTHSD